MEALGIAASIVAVEQLADRIVSVCNSYINGVKDYPKDLRVVYLEIKGLTVIFETLWFLNGDDPDDLAMLTHLGGRDGPIEGCRTAAEALSSLIPPPTSSSPHSRGGKRQKFQDILTTLAWPLKAEQARRLMEDINRHKSTINLAIGGTLL